MGRCKSCGGEFFRRNSLEKYCSPKCAKDGFKSIKRSPIKKRISKSNKSFHKVKLEMAESIMDDPHCENCGIPTSNLDLHHIFYRSEVPHHSMLNDPINLIFCCRDCHEWLHENKENRKHLVESRGLLEIFSKKVGRYSV